MRFLLTSAFLWVAISAAATPPLDLSPQTTESTAAGRVIVRLSTADTPGMARTMDAAGRAHALAALTNDSGLPLHSEHSPAPDLLVVRASGWESAALAERLASAPGVAYAEPDVLQSWRALPDALPGSLLPNDPLFAEQWHLQDREAAAIRATAAWAISSGSEDVVIAVIDSGVLPHADLVARLLPGYDFVSDLRIAGDGDGWDADASDPGDSVSSAEAAAHPSLFSGCSRNSSWHGTRVAGTLGASGNNSIGVAGVDWHSRILPVRALGKCGLGHTSDILAAMRWAAGLPVPGVAANPHPARVLNLSLGSPERCSRAYQDTIAEVSAHGALVVTAAGNSGGEVEQPGNCPGALAVGALRHDGSKVGYASFGPEVGLAAPGGNCGDGALCRYQIKTTTNSGLTAPAEDAYTDGWNSTVGSSFSAAQVAGVAGLLLAVHPQLSPESLRQRLLRSARPFPVSAALPFCPQLGPLGSDIDGQCNCTTQSCGAGMLDAAGAVAAALRPQAQVRFTGSGPVQLDAQPSSAARSRQIVAWRWSLPLAAGNASLVPSEGALVELQAAQAGNYRVRLEVEDDTGERDAIEFEVFAEAGSRVPDVHPVVPPDSPPENPAQSGGGGGSLEASTLALLAGLLVWARRRRSSKLQRALDRCD